MAREDTRWFILAVVVLSVVLFMALPFSMLILVDHMRMQAEIKAEVKSEMKKMRELRKRLEEEASKEK